MSFAKPQCGKKEQYPDVSSTLTDQENQFAGDPFAGAVRYNSQLWQALPLFGNHGTPVREVDHLLARLGAVLRGASHTFLLVHQHPWTRLWNLMSDELSFREVALLR